MSQRGYRPLSQVDIERMIEDDMVQLEDATDEYTAILEQEARAEVAYKRAYNSAYLSRTEGTEKWKVAYAEQESAEELEAFRLAAAKAKAQKEVLWTIRARIDAIRSLNANVRAQV